MRRIASVAFLTLALAGVGLLAWHFHASAARGFSEWPLASIFTAEHLLPLIGLGVVAGQLPRRRLPLGLALLAIGVAAGLLLRQSFFDLMAPVRGAAAQLFLTGPIACVTAGLALLPPRRWRPLIALPLLLPLGAMLAIATVLGDPTLHERGFRIVALAAQVWCAVLIGLLVAMLDAPWLTTGGRILASWLVAIGLLYGGAHIAAKNVALQPPPFLEFAGQGELRGFEAILPALDKAMAEAHIQ